MPNEGSATNWYSGLPGQIDLREAKRRHTAWFVNRFEPIPGGTRFSVSGEIALKGIARLVQPFLRGYVRKQMERWVLEPVKAEAERRAGVPAVTSASPREPVDRGPRRGGRGVRGCGAGIRLRGGEPCWVAGGTALLATIGGPMEAEPRRGGLPAIALGSAATRLKAAGAMLALALLRPWAVPSHGNRCSESRDSPAPR